MAKKRTRKKRRTAAQKRATQKMLRANRARRRTAKKKGTTVAKKRRTTKRRRSGAKTSPKRRRSSRRGMTAVPVVASAAGAIATVGGLYALRKFVENKQKTDPDYKLPELLTTGAPLVGAGVLYAASKFANVRQAKPFVGPALAAGLAFAIANYLNKPKGAGARRLRGSGASAARATIGSGTQMRRLPGGAGASAAAATLAS